MKFIVYQISKARDKEAHPQKYTDTLLEKEKEEKEKREREN